MAIAFVGSALSSQAGATSGTTTIALDAGLTGGSRAYVADGDLVVACFALASAGLPGAVSISDGTTEYTLIGTQQFSNDGRDTSLRIAYKFMGGTPDTDTTFGPTGNALWAGTMAVYVFSGVDATTPLDVAVVETTGINGGQPDPASITPTTSGSVVLVVGAAASTLGAVFTQSGSELSGFASITQADSSDSMLGAGYFEWSSGAFNPVAWTGGTVDAVDSWAASTIALRPASGGGSPVGPLIGGSHLINGGILVGGRLAA